MTQKRFFKIIYGALFSTSLAQLSFAAVSEHEFSMKGEMSYSYSNYVNHVYTEQLQCQILKDGDKLRIKTWISGSNYPASIFICDSNRAFTCVEYTPLRTKKSANNASVWVSTYRRPKYIIGKLVPLWLMVQGNEEFNQKDGRTWTSVFGDGSHFDLDKQPPVIPETKAEPFWMYGFSSYSETFEVQNSHDPSKRIVQENTFTILSWTNFNGIKFPRSFDTVVKRMDKASGGLSTFNSMAQYQFVLNVVEQLPGDGFAVDAPLFSEVMDMRPRELKVAESGASYLSTNGVIYEEILKGAKDPRLPHIVVALGDGSLEKLERNSPRRLAIIFSLIFLTIFPTILWLWRRWLAAKIHGQKNIT